MLVWINEHLGDKNKIKKTWFIKLYSPKCYAKKKMLLSFHNYNKNIASMEQITTYHNILLREETITFSSGWTSINNLAKNYKSKVMSDLKSIYQGQCIIPKKMELVAKNINIYIYIYIYIYI